MHPPGQVAPASLGSGTSQVRRATELLLIASCILVGVAVSDPGVTAEQTAVAEVHAISIYKGKHGQVAVQVSVAERPVVLFLSAYDAVEWVIHAGPGVSIEKVVVSGEHEPVVKGLPSSVPILTLPTEDRIDTYWLDGSWQGNTGATYRNVVTKAKTYLGMSVATFQGGQTAESFIIDGKRRILYPPDVLEAEAQAGPSGRIPPIVASGYESPRSRQQGRPPSNRPIVTASGQINAETIEKYKTIAVFPLKDAPGVPGSGAIAAGMFVGQLTARGFTVVDRTQPEPSLEEQRLHADAQQNQLKMGRSAGATAILVGEVSHWISGMQVVTQGNLQLGNLGNAALAVRLLHAKSGVVLFSGEAQFPDPVLGSPQTVGQTLVRLIVSRLAQKVGLESSGKTGFTWDVESSSGRPKYVVREFKPDSPAYQSGLRSGDVMLSCNGSASATWKTLWGSMRRCRAEAGEVLTLQVERNGKVLTLSVPARDE